MPNCHDATVSKQVFFLKKNEHHHSCHDMIVLPGFFRSHQKGANVMSHESRDMKLSCVGAVCVIVMMVLPRRKLQGMTT